MRIAWRTCGGCNPRYDRRVAIEILQAFFSGKGTLEPADAHQEYDLLFLVGGCPACCIEKSETAVAGGTVRIGSLDDLERWKGCDCNGLESTVPGQADNSR